MTANPPTQYATERNLAARQRLWSEGRREPPFDLFSWVLDLVGIEAGDPRRVLDVGCGNGAYERALLERRHTGARIAVDLSAGMLLNVQDALRVHADVQHLPIAWQSVDVALAPHMLYHVPDVRAAAVELRRVLHPDGVLVAVTNGVGNLGELRHLVESAVGTGWLMARPADRYFCLENGLPLLSAGFEHVTRVDCPPSSVVVTDPETVAEYVASIADHYETEAGVPWTPVVKRVRELASATIDEEGELRLTSAVGAFVCR
jgi:SAM-dependent methyltransferase